MGKPHATASRLIKGVHLIKRGFPRNVNLMIAGYLMRQETLLSYSQYAGRVGENDPRQQSSSIRRQSGREWPSHSSKAGAAIYAGKVGGNDPPTAAKQQHIRAKWEAMTLPQQQSRSSSICRQSGREWPSHCSKSPALSPFTKYNQSMDWCRTIIANRS